MLVLVMQSIKMVVEPSVVKFPSIRIGKRVISYKRGRIVRGKRRSCPSLLLISVDEISKADVNSTENRIKSPFILV